MLNLTKHLNFQYVLEKYSPHIVDISYMYSLNVFIAKLSTYSRNISFFTLPHHIFTQKNCFCRLLKIIILDNYIFLY